MKQPSVWRSFGHAWAGLWWTVRTQRNARIHVVVASLVGGLGWWLEIGRLEWAILVLAIAAVLVGETINTAIEALVDLASPQFDDRARIVKDVSAGAVLLLAIAAIIVGLLILGPPLWNAIQHALVGTDV